MDNSEWNRLAAGQPDWLGTINGGSTMTAPKHPTPQPQDAADNRSRQLNPEHDAYWRSRGEEGRPDSSRTGPTSNVRKNQ